MSSAIAAAKCIRWLEGASLRRRIMICAVIFAAAFVIRAGLVIARGDYERINHVDQSSVALALLQKGEFADPYSVPTGPTSHYAPAHPVLLAGVYRLFGTGVTAELAKQLIACFLSSVLYSILPFAATALRLPLLAGVLAGGLGACLPLKFETETKGEWEAVESAILLIVLSTLLLNSWRSRNLSIRRAVIAGSAWGASFYVAPQLLPMFLGSLALQAFIFWNRQRNAAIGAALLTFTVALAVTLPWTIRNYVQFGKLFFMRDAFGLSLYVSYADGAAVRVTDNYPPNSVHPSVSRKEALEVRAEGEGSYFEERRRRAFEWIRLHPGEALRLATLRFLYFWFHWTGVLVKDAFYWIITALALVSWGRLLRTERLSALYIGVIWATYPILYYVVEASTRYRYPIDWTYFLLACALVADSLCKRFASPGAPSAVACA